MSGDDVLRTVASANPIGANATTTWVPGVHTIDGGGDGAFAADNLSSSQVALTINPQGDVVVDDGAGDVDTLQRFSTVTLSDAVVAISGATLSTVYADGSKTVSTFNITGQSYVEKVQDYTSAGALTETQEYNADGTLIAQILGPQDTNDFNGDGYSDILWSDNSYFADTQTWYSAASGGFTSVDDGQADLNWQVAGAGDFNGDGAADILWRNSDSDDTVLWLSTGPGHFTYENFGAVGGGWEIAGLGDFNADGLADILWLNTNGAIELWQNNPSGGFFYASFGRAVGWQVASVGDFNGDGYSDILWRNTTTGQAETWLTQPSGGFAYAGDGSPSLQWQIAGTGDFGGASGGAGDILWRNISSGDAYLYLSDGGGGFTYKDLGVVSADWQVAEIGSFASNGLSDILWRNDATGDNELWLTKAGGGFSYSSVATAPTNWTVAK